MTHITTNVKYAIDAWCGLGVPRVLAVERVFSRIHRELKSGTSPSWAAFHARVRAVRAYDPDKDRYYRGGRVNY